MLDNIVADKCMASMPIEILADAKVNHRKEAKAANGINQNSAAAPVAKTNKTKTILNWLKYTTTTNDTTTANNNNIKNNNSSSAINDKKDSAENLKTAKSCTCPKGKLPNNTTPEKEILTTAGKQKEEDSFKEYRGVQTLKHFWNKRITANRESVLKAKNNKHHFTKSVSCLVNAINSTGEPPPSPSLSSSPPPLSEKELLKARKLRALSLHDCSSTNLTDFDEIAWTDIDIQKHLEKDNFYKYKTAEQASRLRELSELSNHKKISNGIILPAGQKTERFDWLKRHDKFSRKKSIEHTFTLSVPFNAKVNESDNTATSTKTQIHDIIINEHKMHKQNTTCLPKALGQNPAEVGNANHSSKSSTPTLAPTNSPHQAISCRRATTRKDSSKTLVSASSASVSRDSSTTSLAASANSHKTVVKRNSSARKYSFKTHTRSYHVPRKMHSNKSEVSAAAGVVVSPPNSLVAKLTQQFNEIIQKDKTFLEEIKRKNGVLMTHKGHVYKVVDTTSLNRNPSSPSLSRHDSKPKEGNANQIKSIQGASTVQRNIRKFESESRGLKPKVPLKSLQVLRKSNELVIHKTLTSAKLNMSKMNTTKHDMETKIDVKPQTLALPQALEMVKEEPKTPVDSHESKEIPKPESPELECSLTRATLNLSKGNNKNEVEPKDNEEPQALAPPPAPGMVKEGPKTPTLDIVELQNPEGSLDVEATEETVANTYLEDISKEELNLEKDIKVSASAEQDEFLAVLPPKIDSVIYRSVHKTKQRKQEKPKQKDECESNSALENPDFLETFQKEATVAEATTSNYQEGDQNVASLETPQAKDEHDANDKEAPLQNLETANTSHEDSGINIRETSLIDAASSLSEESEADTKTYENTKDCMSPDSCDEDDKKKRKHKYAKIYEKLRYFTPFAHTNKKQKLTPSHSNSIRMPKSDTTPALTINVTLAKPTDTSTDLSGLLHENPKLMRSGEYTPMSSSTPKKEFEPPDDVYSPMFNPESKLLDALEQVDKKLQNLSHDDDKVLESDEYGHSLKPNASFLHHTKEVTAKPVPVIQAVNVTLVNAIEGEQMIMEQKEIQQENDQQEHDKPPLPPKKDLEEDPFYEPICLDKTAEIKTEPPYHDLEIHTTNINPDANAHFIEEDIYQTVEEVQNELLKPVQKNKNSVTELDGYEPIENPDDLKLSANNSHQSLAPTNYDGYEEYTPKIEIVPLPSTTTTTVVRRVTDELPDLPKPKRILPKSPMPLRTAPKPPLPRQLYMEQTAVANNFLDPPYYGAEENIYDTIKSSHCYESLQSVNNKLQNSPPLLRTKTSDTVSLSSNCYESISHYKRTHTVSHHSGASSTGSTVTISSDNKTNSLYEDSLNSSLHYASKRIYHINAHKPIHINRSSADVHTVNGYGSSISRATDTSDEWTDFSDNENADAENKPKFIM